MQTAYIYHAIVNSTAEKCEVKRGLEVDKFRASFSAMINAQNLVIVQPFRVLEMTANLLLNDSKVKVAGIDFDGVLRGKVMAKEKFLSSLKGGFGMSSAIFGWDMHDVLYTTETSITSANGGYPDLTAEIDLASIRRLSFEGNIPMFLLRFSKNGSPACTDGRSMMASLERTLAKAGAEGYAGVELEFMNFQTPYEDGYGRTDGRQNLAAFLEKHSPDALRPLTSGMFGYSVSRPLMSKDFFHDTYDRSLEMGCPIEGWHTESGPGVFEAALTVSPVARMADNVSLFKLLAKSIGIEHGVTPCFMAKPKEGLPGNSGHIHVSLTDLEGKNMFARETSTRCKDRLHVVWEESSVSCLMIQAG
ncbi:hypothetical protein AK830_g8530 [Neonectria ditissima]|uniref:GS catalytic domain-containing protein n=1 Tax=Neonectria ditissima TaxID=78410 RepID=A0A0P7BE22_9HYPO|nr:hypothetical protein AK830_g8530 [Neonectria ditissima]